MAIGEETGVLSADAEAEGAFPCVEQWCGWIPCSNIRAAPSSAFCTSVGLNLAWPIYMGSGVDRTMCSGKTRSIVELNTFAVAQKEVINSHIKE